MKSLRQFIHQTMPNAIEYLNVNITTELVQDLKAIHGIDAEEELAQLIKNEIAAECRAKGIKKYTAGYDLVIDSGQSYLKYWVKRD